MGEQTVPGRSCDPIWIRRSPGTDRERLRAVYEITELRFPDNEVAGIGEQYRTQTRSTANSKHRVLDLKARGELAEGREACPSKIVEHGVAVAERAAFGVLSHQPNGRPSCKRLPIAHISAHPSRRFFHLWPSRASFQALHELSVASEKPSGVSVARPVIFKISSWLIAVCADQSPFARSNPSIDRGTPKPKCACGLLLHWPGLRRVARGHPLSSFRRCQP